MREAEHVLQDLVGFPLSIARSAGGMKVFHFGRIVPHHSGRGTVGDWALHLQCPWHLVGPDGMITASNDRYLDALGEPFDPEMEDADPKSGSLQAIRLLNLF